MGEKPNQDKAEQGTQTKGLEADHPGLIAPPPIIYLISIATGLALHYFSPMSILPNSIGVWLGGLIIVLSVSVLALCLREFQRWKTPVNPHRPTAAIIQTGPFGYSRNPVYISLTGLQTGIAFIANSMWVLALLVPTLMIIYGGVILREERYLERKFGTEYTNYKASARRWF